MQLRYLTFPFIIFFIVACQAEGTQAQAEPRAPATYVGYATYVFDGDSFIAQVESGKLEVRIAAIDAPEHYQDYAEEARAALIEMLTGALEIRVITYDKFERAIAEVTRLADKTDIAKQMVVNGHAWVYPKYRRDEHWMNLEALAKKQKRGLWGEEKHGPAIAPWSWRREHPYVRKKTEEQSTPMVGF